MIREIKDSSNKSQDHSEFLVGLLLSSLKGGSRALSILFALSLPNGSYTGASLPVNWWLESGLFDFSSLLVSLLFVILNFLIGYSLCLFVL